MRRGILVAAFLALTVIFTSGAMTPAGSQTVSVAYVIGMLQAGMDQRAITQSLHGRAVAFRRAPGDIDRLRAAGAGDELVQAVAREGAVLDTPQAEGAPPGAASHPRRMTHEGVAPPEE